MQRWNEYNGRLAQNVYIYRTNSTQIQHNIQYEQKRAPQRTYFRRWNEGFSPSKRQNENNNGNKRNQLNRITGHYETAVT